MRIRDSKTSSAVREVYYQGHMVQGLPISSPDGLPFVMFEIDGQIGLFLEIPEGKTSLEIREAIPQVLRWRRLLDTKGEWIPIGDEDFVLGALLHCKRVLGLSYRELSVTVNRLIADYLKEYAEYKKECANHGLDPDKPLRYELSRQDPDSAEYEWAPKIAADPRSWGHARLIMEIMRLKDTEIEELSRLGLAIAEEGEEPFEKGYPISRDKIRSRLRPYLTECKEVKVTDYDMISLHPIALEIYVRAMSMT